MGRRGPKPTPTDVLNQRGSWRGKAREGELSPEVVTPECPKWVSRKGRNYWAETAALLAEYGIMTNFDRMALGLLCDAMADYQEARKTVEKEGATVTTGNGSVYQHPAVGMRNKAWEQVKNLCKEFYLTPSARTGVKVDGEKKKTVEEERKRRFFEPELPCMAEIEGGKGA